MGLRVRLAASHFILVLTVVIIIGLMSLGRVRNFILRSARDTLVTQAENIVEVIDRRLFNADEPPSVRLAPSLVRLLSTLTEADFVVTSHRGRVLVSSERLRPLVGGFFLPELVERAVAEGTPLSNTFRDPLGRLSVIVVAPVPAASGGFTSGAPVGALALVRPVVEVGRTTQRLVYLFLLASFAGLGLSLVVSLVLARTLTRPLRALETAAARVAAGDFEQRVKVTDDELGRVAASFNRMAARLGELRRERQDLYANVSHELRTPVTSIKGFAQALEDNIGCPEEQRRHLTIIQEEAARLERLVSDLFQLARLEAGQVTFEWRSVDMGLLSSIAVTRAVPQAKAGGTDLCLGDLPAAVLWVRGDPDRLGQVMANLIDNALRFTPRGGRIAVRVERAESGLRGQQGAWVMVSVRDSGPGIPDDDLERIFERFYTVERSRARRKTGTGLGLAIAREIVEAHGGEIRAERGPEGGALLVFALPLAPGADDAGAGSRGTDTGGGSR